MATENIWHPEKFLNCIGIENAGSYAVVVLNRPINADKELIQCLWNHGEIYEKILKSLIPSTSDVLINFSFFKNHRRWRNEPMDQLAKVEPP